MTQQQPWIVDNTHNYLIHHPDILISCTAVAESFFCVRKSVLQQMSKQVHEFSEPLVSGDVIHRTLQYCLENNDFSAATIEQCMKNVICTHHMDSLYVLDMDESTLFDHLSPYIGGIMTFGSRYVSQTPNADATITRDVGPTANHETKAVAIRGVLDIEEHVWSPAYGLKGMVDATIELMLAPSNKILTIPFELKTGKTNRLITHRAQTVLYTLLLGDRYGLDIKCGALYYTKVNAFYMVPQLRSEIQSLLIARNDLATALQQRSNALPPMARNIHKCQYCAVSNACFTYHIAIEQGDVDSSGLGQWFTDHVEHLDDNCLTFFQHWIRLIGMEEHDLESLRKDIWTVDADERESAGKCFKDMVLKPQFNKVRPGGYWYTFARARSDDEQRSLTESHITPGDPMVISSMEGDLHLGMGFVVDVDRTTITISLSAPLRPRPVRSQEFDIENCQVFVKWRKLQLDGQQSNNAITYRLDKDEAAGGFQVMKTNIVNLMTKTSGVEDLDVARANLRRLIVDLEPPLFTLGDAGVSTYLHRDSVMHCLNSDQKAAMAKVLACQDYALILGMPGTGKTTTVAEIISMLVQQGKSVLLTAYTHNALDNLLCKLMEKGIDFLRLGNPDKFILVGDQYQLPPIVKDPEAQRNGFGESLFMMLSAKHPEAVVYLKYQYRMNRDIMQVSSQLFYDRKLRCGNDTVANKRIQYAHFPTAMANIHASSHSCADPCWLRDILDPR
ncbi:Dna2-domain-containing protein [Hesseltinella vesiculosa]|uniref:DNA helicase n=1 Tax=Hesseltinella vesiculosa TaxID=101127 RepID=A0A1X2GE60_9FUNG|nr:Dna2-domain-containing protein [Hesseltinella vesiculosa]